MQHAERQLCTCTQAQEKIYCCWPPYNQGQSRCEHMPDASTHTLQRKHSEHSWKAKIRDTHANIRYSHAAQTSVHSCKANMHEHSCNATNDHIRSEMHMHVCKQGHTYRRRLQDHTRESCFQDGMGAFSTSICVCVVCFNSACRASCTAV